MNLSNKKFTKHEFELLNRNLNICPRPNQFNKSNFNKDLQVFFRRVTTDVRQPWTNPQDCYFEYLIIRFDYLIIRFDYLIIG